MQRTKTCRYRPIRFGHIAAQRMSFSASCPASEIAQPSAQDLVQTICRTEPLPSSRSIRRLEIVAASQVALTLADSLGDRTY